MATYAIGDVQGCADVLARLLRRIAFAPGRDRLWFVGDLVNRGPDSAGVLRLLRRLGPAVTAVLGNHDLKLLAAARGLARLRPGDTLSAVLDQPDAADLLAWLGALPLMVRGEGHVLLHAGLLPSWTIEAAGRRAAAAEAVLRGPGAGTVLAQLATPLPPADRGGAAPDAPDEVARTIKVLTYLRVCTAAGEPDFAHTGPPEAAPPGLLPWFAVPQRRSADTTIVCGHWAALGLHLQDNVRALDTGAVYGRALTAYRLGDGAIFAEPTG